MHFYSESNGQRSDDQAQAYQKTAHHNRAICSETSALSFALRCSFSEQKLAFDEIGSGGMNHIFGGHESSVAQEVVDSRMNGRS